MEFDKSVNCVGMSRGAAGTASTIACWGTGWPWAGKFGYAWTPGQGFSASLGRNDTNRGRRKKGAAMTKNDPSGPPGLSEEDILRAMRDMHGYVDVTPGDFREIYETAYVHARARLARTTMAREIMTSPAHCLGLDMAAPEAARFLSGRGVTGAPVLDGSGAVCGVVSEKDFLRKMGVTGAPSLLDVVARCLGTTGCLVADLRGLTVAGLMTAPAITAPEDITVEDVSSLFMEKSINRLPICDSDGRPLGIVTRTDLVRALQGQR